MRFAKSFLMGTGSVVLAGLLLTLLAPKAAHAVAATLVQVENTRSTPVPNQDVDIAARHPFNAICSVPISGASVDCSPIPAPPTTGFETVIQNVSMSISLYSGSGTPFVHFDYLTQGGVLYGQFPPIVPQGPGYWSLSQPTTAYVDPSPAGNPLYCEAIVPATFTSGFLICAVTGYTVTLP